MRICVYVSWSIGGVLADACHNVSLIARLIARGPHLAALQAKGCTVETGGRTFTVHPQCSDDPADFGPQDYVVVAVKAPAMPSVADSIGPFLGPETVFVPAMNGVPW